MPTNIEVKAIADDLQILEQRLLRHGAVGPQVLQQCDTFFYSDAGRIKLREIRGHASELVIYVRPDIPGPKKSEYLVLPVEDAGLTHRIMSLTHGSIGTVEKVRKPFLLSGARIHLDAVKNLGSYLEVEIVLAEGFSEESGTKLMRSILNILCVSPRARVAEAYIDLLRDKAAAVSSCSPGSHMDSLPAEISASNDCN